MNEHFLDVKGLNCPMPIIKLSKFVKNMSIGDTVRMEATDRACKTDVDAWCEKTGNKLRDWKNDGEVSTIVVEKAVG